MPPIIRELFALLPPPGSVLTPTQKSKWIDAAEAILDMIYQQQTLNPKPPKDTGGIGGGK